MATEPEAEPTSALGSPASTAGTGSPAPVVGARAATLTAASGDPAEHWSGVVEWLFRRRSLRAARAALPLRSSRFRQARQRARVAAELADRLADPVDPLRFGDASSLLVDLYRQSIYWSLCALFDLPSEGQQPASLCNAALHLHAVWLAPEPRTRETLTSLLSNDFGFERSAGLGAEPLRVLAEDAQTLARRLLAVLAAPERRVDRLIVQRATRLLMCCVLVAGAAFGTLRWRAWSELRPNLAAGKAWRTSSTWAQCEPEIGMCGGKPTAVFFHTNEEASPWIEYDLGRPTRFSRVYVKNRTDSLPDRAIPLLVEASNDRNHWRGLARRRETFTTWTAKFEPVTMRYVRLRVARRSLLHLEQVKVLP